MTKTKKLFVSRGEMIISAKLQPTMYAFAETPWRPASDEVGMLELITDPEEWFETEDKAREEAKEWAEEGSPDEVHIVEITFKVLPKPIKKKARRN